MNGSGAAGFCYTSWKLKDKQYLMRCLISWGGVHCLLLIINMGIIKMKLHHLAFVAMAALFSNNAMSLGVRNLRVVYREVD